MATPKQEKFINLLVENLGSGNKKSLGEMLLEAGYSKSIAKNPYQILETEAVKEAINPVAEQMARLRQKALDSLEERELEKEPVRDVVKAVDTFTKNHQLLTGGKTESNEITVTWKS